MKQLDAYADIDREQPFVRSALLRRLADDDPVVVEAALASPAMRVLQPEELAQGVSNLLRNARGVFEDHKLDKASRKSLREVVKKVWPLRKVILRFSLSMHLYALIRRIAADW